MRKVVRLLGFVCAVLIVAAPGVSAQTSILNNELLKDWVEMRDTIAKLANEMPEDKYVYKSTPAQRDFAQQVMHIAQANVINLAFLRGKAMPPTLNRAARSKAEVMKAMADSFDYGEALIKEQTDQSMLEVVQTNAFLGPSSRARVVYFLLGHTWDIYGQMVVYLRLSGGVPPASQRP